MPRKWAVLLLVAVLAGQGALRGEEKKTEDPRLRKALERSLLFPGLGQLGEKQYLKAALFAATEIACLALVVVNARRGNDAYRNYREATTIDGAVEWRQRTESFDQRRNTAILAATGIWVLNMIDIFLHAKRRYGRKKSVAFHPYYRHENHAYGVGASCRF
ncbi:MAG: hypothetical protein JXO51_11770 [Candidatus Aminicenantes bacterium]|nr:hypothetical protein [Candidatus Aminicenantes bacterium]